MMIPNNLVFCLILCMGCSAMCGLASADETSEIHNTLDFLQGAFPDIPGIGDLINKIFQKKCMGDLGCFSNGPPFYHPLLRPISLVPFDLKDIKTKFYLYTSEHNRTLLEPTAKSLASSPYDKSLGLQVFIHGFFMKFTPDILKATEAVIGAIMKADRQNVILVDWTTSNQNPYPQAVANGRVVGAQIAKLVNFLKKTAGLDPKNVYLIGHSLGTHVAGWAGQRIPNLGRITGLDPAGPYFQFSSPEIRLDRSDAQFVDIIHTNAADNPLIGLGILEPIGHVDFYPNAGKLQPGCDAMGVGFTIAGIKFDLKGLNVRGISDIMAIVCSHIRSVDFFLESAANRNCKFNGTECPDYQKFKLGKCKSSKQAEMGFFAKKGTFKKGSKFFLTTSNKQPYCEQK